MDVGLLVARASQTGLRVVCTLTAAVCSQSLERNAGGQLSPAGVDQIKRLSDDLDMSEAVCERYFLAAPTAPTDDPIFEGMTDVLSRARLYFYYERRQLLQAICDLVKGRDSNGMCVDDREWLVDVTNDVLLTPDDSNLPRNLIRGIARLTEECKSAGTRDEVKRIRAVADRQRVCSCTVVYRHLPSCTVVYRRVLSCAVVHRRVLSCTVVYCRVLSCTVVYRRVPSCTVLHRALCFGAVRWVSPVC